MSTLNSLHSFIRKSIITLLLLSLTNQIALAKMQEVPDGFDDYLVFMATGTIPFAPHPDTNITGCGTSLFCDGDYFHQNIMGRSQAEIDIEEQKAKDYFYTRFGLDVDLLAAEGRIAFFSFFLDPRGEYRAYTVANEKASSEGWIVRDGGFAVMVLDPDGVELGGEFEGLGLSPIPPEGMLVYGNYNILKTNKAGKNKGEIVISYRSDMPMIANAWGELVVNCQLSINDFANNQHGGKAQGMGLVLPSAHGLTLSWRNVLTIGGL